MQNARSRFYLFNVGIPLLVALAIFLAFDMTNLDRVISNLFYDPVTKLFTAEHHHLFEKLTHKWPRYIPDLTAELAGVGFLLSLIWPCVAKRAGIVAVLDKIRFAPLLRLTARFRRDLLYVVLAFSLSTATIHFLKSRTDVYCPVEVTQYGGGQLEHPWYDRIGFTHKVGKGRCWPGGHASAGFSMLALYFVARRYRWKHSWALFNGVMVLGMVFGTTRVLQGWHFFSHNLWAGVIVWFTSLLMALLLYGRARIEQPVLSRAQTAPPADTVELLPGSSAA